MSKELKEILEDLSKLETRAKEINAECSDADEKRLNELNTELDDIEARKLVLTKKKDEIELRQKEVEQVKLGAGNEINLDKGENRNMEFGIETVEYRDAFWAYLKGEETKEQRDALITTANGVALPKTTEKLIYDLIHEAHPILEDINIYETGMVLEITQHKAITSGKAKKVAEGEANVMEENTFAKVTLSGKDYAKTVEVSYAEMKMSNGALEKYLAKEIADDLGEALAKDVFARIKEDCAANKVDVKTKLDYNTFLSAFGKTNATDLVVYCNNKNKYQNILGMVDANGQPVVRDGVALGAKIKADSASGDDIFVLDPKAFTGNMIQSIMIEQDKDIKTHKHNVSGYCRFEGCMTDTRKGAFITLAA